MAGNLEDNMAQLFWQSLTVQLPSTSAKSASKRWQMKMLLLLSKLDEREREILSLHFGINDTLKPLPHGEVADRISGTTKQAMVKHVHRALSHLRDLLMEELNQELARQHEFIDKRYANPRAYQGQGLDAPSRAPKYHPTSEAPETQT